MDTGTRHSPLLSVVCLGRRKRKGKGRRPERLVPTTRSGRFVKSDSVTPAIFVANPPRMPPRPPERLFTDMSAAYSEASTPANKNLKGTP